MRRNMIMNGDKILGIDCHGPSERIAYWHLRKPLELLCEVGNPMGILIRTCQIQLNQSSSLETYVPQIHFNAIEQSPVEADSLLAGQYIWHRLRKSRYHVYKSSPLDGWINPILTFLSSFLRSILILLTFCLNPVCQSETWLKILSSELRQNPCSCRPSFFVWTDSPVCQRCCSFCMAVCCKVVSHFGEQESV